MPVIKQNKILASNPDSVYSASKKVQTMSLRNMTNNTGNPDTAVKSAITLKDGVINDANEFLSGLDILDTNLNQIIAYVNAGEELFSRVNFATSAYNPYANMRRRNPSLVEFENYNPVSGSGRPKGSKNKSKEVQVGQQTIPSLWGATSAEENMELPLQQQNELFGNEWADFYSSMGSAPIDPPASVAYGSLSGMYQTEPEYLENAVEESDDEAEAVSGASGTEPASVTMGTADDSSSDDEMSYSSFGARTKSTNAPSSSRASSSKGTPPDDEDPEGTPSSSSWGDESFKNPVPNENPLINSMVRVSELITRLNVNFNGKIKRNINMLDKLDVQSLASKSEDVAKTFNKINGEYIGLQIENGVIFYDTMLARMNKLRTDILIAVKSYAPKKQGAGMMSDSMRGGASSGAGAMSAGAGAMSAGAMCGGSFQTSPMGYNAPNIPTIYNSFVRSCPTKYLM
jgi:hypothetical protein